MAQKDSSAGTCPLYPVRGLSSQTFLACVMLSMMAVMFLFPLHLWNRKPQMT